MPLVSSPTRSGTTSPRAPDVVAVAPAAHDSEYPECTALPAVRVPARGDRRGRYPATHATDHQPSQPNPHRGGRLGCPESLRQRRCSCDDSAVVQLKRSLGTGSLARRGALVGLTAACLFASTPAAASRAASPSPLVIRAGSSLTLYSFAEQEQFVNNQDDRSRGEGHNPFGTYGDVSPPVQELRNGPFPGDTTFVSFNIYATPSLKHKVGSAVFTCQYNFNKNAFCDAAFQLSGGTLIAEGSFDFDATTFTLAITGGYGSYGNITGSVAGNPSAHHAQRLSFRFD